MNNPISMESLAESDYARPAVITAAAVGLVALSEAGDMLLANTADIVPFAHDIFRATEELGIGIGFLGLVSALAVAVGHRLGIKFNGNPYRRFR